MNTANSYSNATRHVLRQEHFEKHLIYEVYTVVNKNILKIVFLLFSV